MISALLPLLTSHTPITSRLQHIVQHMSERFSCNAVGLLQLDAAILRIVTATGLSKQTMGRRFLVSEHPRFSAILQSKVPTRFEENSPLPDPYDGLLDNQRDAPLAVHDCLGFTLTVRGNVWGIVTLDSLWPGTFTEHTSSELQSYKQLLEAALYISELEEQTSNLQRFTAHSSPVPTPNTPYGLLGDSPALTRVLQELNAVADSDLPVLLLGEVGVKKELFAYYLHQHSTWRHRPWIYVNCATLPEAHAESQLFGQAKDAMPHITSDRIGYIESANGGTLFLDEIGALSLAAQAKLLHVLRRGELQRVGADHSIPVKIRFISATHCNLQHAIEQGSFRSDLYHYLAVFPVSVPPLRERGNDILQLAEYFLENSRSKLGLRNIRFSSDAELALLSYSWPGNIHELEHVISRAAIKLLSLTNDRNQIFTIKDKDLNLSQITRPLLPNITRPTLPEQASEWPSLRQTVETVERQLIRDALNATQNNWAHAARLLDMDSSNLHKLAIKLGVKRSPSKRLNP